MKINDLYIIIGELKQINVLQANLVSRIKLSGDTAGIHIKQRRAFEKLKKLLEKYDKNDK